MKSKLKTLWASAGAALTIAAMDANAYSTNGAKSLGDISGNITSSLAGVNSAVESFAYVAAMVMVIIGILKFKAHRDDPRSTPLGTPIAIWVCAGLFAFAPNLIGTAGTTIWGSGVEGVQAPISRGY